jgi:hypothetical protein
LVGQYLADGSTHPTAEPAAEHENCAAADKREMEPRLCGCYLMLKRTSKVGG